MTHAILSRRTLVASAAALPAVAALPVASALASTGSPDVELLRLGAKLAVVERERSAQMAIDRANDEAGILIGDDEDENGDSLWDRINSRVIPRYQCHP
jgi:hypothetical protein